MSAGLKQAVIGSAIGVVYWSAFSEIASTSEPWDGAYYWSAAYPGSLVIAVALGFVWRRRAWITGSSLTFAQLPIMAVNTGLESLALLGVGFLSVLSIPVILAAGMTSMRQQSTVKD